MHLNTVSLLTNMAPIMVGILAVGFLLWFLIGLTLEKNGAHVRCRIEFQMNDVSTVTMDRQPIREVSASRPWREDEGLVEPSFRPAHILVTHRALHAVGLSAKGDLNNEPWQAGPYLIRQGR